MKTLSVLLFDVDGTLADTEWKGHLKAYNLAFKEAKCGWFWSEDTYRHLLSVAGGKERMHFYIMQNSLEKSISDDIDEFVTQLYRLKTRHLINLLATGDISLRTGVKRLLTEAQSVGMRLAIVTTTSLINVQHLLKNTLSKDALLWFDVIATGEDAANKKPAPDVYQHALKQLALAPEQCIAFEDSSLGLQSALAAGVPTIVTYNHYTERQDFTGAAVVINHLGEPHKPFTVKQGSVFEQTYMSLSLIHQIHNKLAAG